MSRLDVELTSQRGDGTWTWRAAGAKQPKGDLDGSLLPEGTKIGDILKVDADIAIDGIVVTAVLPPQKARHEPQRLHVIGPSRREGGVTASLVTKGGHGERGNRGKRPRDGEPRNRGDRPERRERGDRGDRQPPPKRDRRERGGRPDRDDSHADSRSPKARRLKPGRQHRSAALAALPEEQRLLADQVLRGGVPGVRQTIEKLNQVAATDGRPPIDTERLLALAERLLPPLRGAEWRDRAEAALAQLDTVDLGDLRSVVNAADTWARDEESRSLASELREGLPRRVEREHQEWLDEIAATLADGRLIRALRLSSRPPKAGAPLPPDIASRLAEAASAGMTADTGSERYATIVDALALSPVHGHVAPRGKPERVNEELLGTIRQNAHQLPQIAALFGVEPPVTPTRSSRRPRPAPKPSGATHSNVPPPPPIPRHDTAAAGSTPSVAPHGDTGDADVPTGPDQVEPQG